jgi:maltose alpha-D-glucosyltransferase/alpha-amylase
MQWSNEKNLGFSNGKSENLYFPVDSSSNAPTVANQDTDKKSLLNFVRSLTKLKREQPALSGYASFYPVYAMPNKYPYIFMRVLNNEKLLIAINPSSNKASASINGDLSKFKKLLLGSELDWKTIGSITNVEMEAKTYAVYKIK